MRVTVTVAGRERSDPDLAIVAESPPTLPKAIRAGIVAMVKSATEGRRHDG